MSDLLTEEEELTKLYLLAQRRDTAYSGPQVMRAVTELRAARKESASWARWLASELGLGVDLVPGARVPRSLFDALAAAWADLEGLGPGEAAEWLESEGCRPEE